MPSQTVARYTPVARLLHWTTAVLVLATIPMGFVLLDLPPGRLQNTLFDVHRSIGVLLFVLVAVRLAWRLTHPPPPLPAGVPAWQHLASAAVHHLLYAILLIQPIIGWWGTSAFGAPINVFWLFELPALVGKDEPTAKQILAWHGIIGITLSVAIAIHIGAALFHHFVRRDGVLRRML
ncbi:cytochrome b [Reyranella sp. CPCC 100927]|uniref:cytochrome b n=1 Tax=Reyranella sp. CPCC 100927 TaxID=2599616 RepID=UPI0011B60CE6|nr:cytochrome b [Reyranella sp. CPCC 100927]TWS94272.1 cytochrome b [Reyranella sp. CPCC 100927]